MSDSNRILPKITDENRFFWTSGKDGKLRFLQCDECRTYIHPPAPVCRKCLSEDLSEAVVSGRGRVHTFSINYHRWNPAVDVPYVIAVVEMDEQPALRLTTNIVGAPVKSVEVGQEVQVTFEACENNVFLPLFELI